jgi:type IV fimbrial biogenesis protein FimT
MIKVQNNTRALMNERGVSLLEILVVVAITGVVVAFAIPQVSRSLELQKLDTASARVSSKLSEARANAIKRNTLAKLNITAGSNTMQCATAAITIGPVETLPDGITFSTGSPANVTFDSLGRLNTTAQTVTLQSPSGKSKTISISVKGEITVGAMN